MNKETIQKLLNALITNAVNQHKSGEISWFNIPVSSKSQVGFNGINCLIRTPSNIEHETNWKTQNSLIKSRVSGSNESHLIDPFTEYFEESEDFIKDCKQMPSLKQHQVPNFKGVHNSCDQCDYKASRTTIHKEKYNFCDQSNKIAKKSNLKNCLQSFFLQKLLNYKNNRYYFQRH